MTGIPIHLRRLSLALALGALAALFASISGVWIDKSWNLDGAGQVGNIAITMAALLLGWRYGMVTASISVLPRLILALCQHAPMMPSVLFVSFLTIVEAGLLGWAVRSIRPLRLRQIPLLVDLLFWVALGMPACLLFRRFQNLEQDAVFLIWAGVISYAVLGLLHTLGADLISSWNLIEKALRWAEVPRERQNLRTVLLRNLLLVGILPLLLLMLIDGPASAKRRQHEAEVHLADAANVVAQGIGATVKRQRTALETLAEQINGLALRTDTREIETRVKGFHKLFPDFRTISVADTTGAIQVLSSPAQATADRLALARTAGIADRDYFDTVRATHSSTLSRIYFGRVSAAPLVSIAVPLMRDGVWMGVLSGSISPANLDEIFREYPNLQEAKVVAADYEQQVVFSNWPGLKAMDSFLETSLFAAWMKNQKQSHAVFPFTGEQVGALTVAHVMCGDTGWRFFVALPDKQIHGQSSRNYMLFVFWLVLAGCLSFGLSHWLGERLSRPLETLVDRLHGFDLHDSASWSMSPADQASTEIVALADSFSSMSKRLGESWEAIESAASERERLNAQLKRQAATLEAKVVERTAALNQSTARANLASRAKTEFLANMSHELRTPMNGVIGVMSLAIDAMPLGDEREQMSTARQSAQALTNLLSAILDFSNIEAGRLRLEPHAFSLRACVEQAVETINVLAAAKGLKIETWIGETFPDRLVGDSYRLGQILMNLLNNAVKFSEPDPLSGRGTVRIEVKEAAYFVPGGRAHLRFLVSDEGIGIAPGKMATIFNPFEQGEGSSTRRFGGMGLGLSITQKLLELMDSTIEVESLLNSGSTFAFDLALEKAADSYCLLSPSEPKATVADSLDILLAEDNLVNQTVARRILERAGHRVTVANNGREALEHVNAKSFDLVLMDIQMPEIDGLEATKAIRGQERGCGRRLPIIAVTANAMKGDDEMCFRAGMDAYLTKPVKKESLLAAIEKFTAHAA